VAAFAVQELPGQAGDWFGQGDRCRAEVDLDRGAADGDVIGGQAGDPGDGRGVEKDEQPGEPVPGVDRVVVQQPAGALPAGFVVQGLDWALPLDGGDGDRGQPLPGGPADEVPRIAAAEVPAAARGAGDRPSDKIPGRAVRAWASLRTPAEDSPSVLRAIDPGPDERCRFSSAKPTRGRAAAAG
jgi:hypothetical protein